MMIRIKKLYAWCVQHWRWLVFSVVAIVAYLLGKKNAKGLFEQARLAKNHYKKEAEMIEKVHKQKHKKITKANASHQKKINDIENKKKISIQHLEEEKRKEIEKYLNDPKKLDEVLSELGIKEV